MAFRVPSVFLVQPVLRAPPERMEIREKSADPDRKEAKETRVNWVHQAQAVFRVSSEHLVQRAAMVSLDPEDNRVCLDRKETKDPEDSPAFLDPSGCRGCLDLLVRKERMETSAQWVHLVLLAPEVLKVLVEPVEPKVLLVVSVQWEVSVRREKLERLATLDRLESLVSEVAEERLGRREKPVHPGLPDHLAAADPLEMMVPRVTLVLLASPETLAPLVSLVLVALMVYQVTKEMMERLGNLALQVHPVKLEYQDLLANGDLLDKQVRKANKERKDPREKLEQRGL